MTSALGCPQQNPSTVFVGTFSKVGQLCPYPSHVVRQVICPNEGGAIYGA